MKIVAFDIDDVICVRPKDKESDGLLKYTYSIPIQKNIDIINQCYDSGYYIKLYTARGMSQFNGDLHKIYDNLYVLTKKHLDEWGVKYHELIMGKIHYDLLIDDKALNIDRIDTIKDIKKFLGD